jgi:hypothetical protein
VLKEPNVYIGEVTEDDSFSPDLTPDDDQDRKTPVEVIQILGFDPKELRDG